MCGDSYNVSRSAGGDVVVVAVFFDVTGVKEVQYVACGESAAGVNTVSVLGNIGTEDDSGKRPVQEVGTLPVPPAFIAAAEGTVRRILKINVVVSAEEDNRRG